MPGIGSQYWRESKERMAVGDRQDHCAYSTSELSQAALNAAVVRIVAMEKDPATGWAYSNVELVKQLGGSEPWTPNEIVRADFTMDGPQGNTLRDAISQQRPLIVLYPRSPKNNELLPYTCGVLPDSEQAEKEVAAGVALGKGFPEYD